MNAATLEKYNAVKGALLANPALRLADALAGHDLTYATYDQYAAADTNRIPKNRRPESREVLEKYARVRGLVDIGTDVTRALTAVGMPANTYYRLKKRPDIDQIVAVITTRASKLTKGVKKVTAKTLSPNTLRRRVARVDDAVRMGDSLDTALARNNITREEYDKHYAQDNRLDEDIIDIIVTDMQLNGKRRAEILREYKISGEQLDTYVTPRLRSKMVRQTADKFRNAHRDAIESGLFSSADLKQSLIPEFAKAHITLTDAEWTRVLTHVQRT
jgi:hypothetical protein